MKFLLRYTLQLAVIFILLVFLYEVGDANYTYFTSHAAGPLVDSLKALLKNTNESLNHSVELISLGKIGSLKLVS